MVSDECPGRVVHLPDCAVPRLGIPLVHPLQVETTLQTKQSSVISCSASQLLQKTRGKEGACLNCSQWAVCLESLVSLEISATAVRVQEHHCQLGKSSETRNLTASDLLWIAHEDVAPIQDIPSSQLPGSCGPLMPQIMVGTLRPYDRGAHLPSHLSHLTSMQASHAQPTRTTQSYKFHRVGSGHVIHCCRQD